MTDRFICADCARNGKTVTAQVFYGKLDLCRPCASLRGPRQKRRTKFTQSIPQKEEFQFNSTRWPAIISRLADVAVGEETDIVPDVEDVKRFAKNLRNALTFTKGVKVYRFSLKRHATKISVVKLGTWDEKDAMCLRGEISDAQARRYVLSFGAEI